MKKLKRATIISNLAFLLVEFRWLLWVVMLYTQAQLLQNDGAIGFAYWLGWAWMFCVARFVWAVLWWWGQLRWALYCLELPPADRFAAAREVRPDWEENYQKDDTDVLFEDFKKAIKEAKDERTTPE